MSSFGGMDRGVPGDTPFLGKTVIFRNISTYLPAIVTAVREDGWTVSLQVFGENEQFSKSFVPHNDGDFGEITDQSWVTLDEYEGWKIYAAERAAKDPREEG